MNVVNGFNSLIYNSNKSFGSLVFHLMVECDFWVSQMPKTETSCDDFCACLINHLPCTELCPCYGDEQYRNIFNVSNSQV